MEIGGGGVFLFRVCRSSHERPQGLGVGDGYGGSLHIYIYNGSARSSSCRAVAGFANSKSCDFLTKKAPKTMKNHGFEGFWFIFCM